MTACKAGSARSQSARLTGLNLLPVTPEAEAGKTTRLAFVLEDDQKEFITPKSATVRFGPTQEKFTSPAVQGRVYTDAGLAPPYVVVDAELAPKGVVWAQLTADGRSATAPIMIVDARPGLVPGQPMPKVRTPSPGDNAGVELVCTRPEAPCPWHDISLDQLVGQGRPLAVLVGTPAFCESRTCGPVLEVLLRAAPDVGDKVHFVHLEVYAVRPTGPDVSRTPLAPAIKAFGLESEPILFLVNPDGTVKDRIDGLFGLTEARAALQTLL